MSYENWDCYDKARKDNGMYIHLRRKLERERNEKEVKKKNGKKR